ncbi:hypothetical protein OCU04_004023 [Sclerotinia nivalis]|uniref:Aminoglycoside phosphotransferase domain-containing protein n=1 Tax=Sclerotinia nivalis TaxID=352851 RepID=A0A9X0ATW2_9HELO|nr:hypothetical protein OCU04_004023 [Sclerotinia nivalis]
MSKERRESLDLDSATARAKSNTKTMERLQAAVKEDPDVNLLDFIPKTYLRSWLRKEELTDRPQPLPIKLPYAEPDFCAGLAARARTATIAHPLSTETISCLIVHLDSSSSAEDVTSNQCLVSALKHLILNSEKLCELPTRGVVLKCSDHLVAKIIRGNDDYTEYTSLQYLQDNAPALLAPKPHGLVKLNDVHIIFMTYIPSVTLEQVWGTLTHDNKLLIQSQLDEMFVKLRLLSHDSQCLGGVRGEGVKVDGAYGAQLHKKGISTAEDFDNFCFSAVSHRASTSWVNFVRSLLPAWEDNFVFSHGDLRPANIMVTPGEGGNYVLSGVIDWEDSGFYPDYFESRQLLYTFGMGSEDDWYAYLPPSISPATHPQRWLVGRIWRYTLERC